MKIVYCLNSVSLLGGIQRATIVKANALADIEGNEIYAIVSDNNSDVMVHPLSNKVHLIDLGINYYDGDTERSYLMNALVYAQKMIKHKKALKRKLFELKPDVVISVGTFEKHMLPAMRNRTWKIVREFHLVSNYRKLLYRKSLVGHLTSAFASFYDFKVKLKQYDKVVVLTEEDKDTNFVGWKNVVVMPNPVSFECNSLSSLTEKCVSGLGRLHSAKNFSSLINAFNFVSKKHPDWVLRIYGDGDRRPYLEQQIKELNLQDKVFLMGFTNDIKTALIGSSIFALSSITEGFSLAIVEAMECGVPAVSYQCPYGPKDLITDGSNGFLVPTGDEKMMAERICTLIEDEELRKRMGKAAKLRAQDFHIESIAKKWMTLFEELVKS